MASRRMFLKLGVGAYAAGALEAGVSIRSGSNRVSVVPYKVIFDERFADTRALAAAAADRGIRTAGIRGDITSLFFDDLDLRWRLGPVMLAGYTTAASLFCLDLLARDRGMRLKHCAVHASVDDAVRILDGGRARCESAMAPLSPVDALVFWIIVPSAERAL